MRVVSWVSWACAQTSWNTISNIKKSKKQERKKVETSKEYELANRRTTWTFETKGSSSKSVQNIGEVSTENVNVKRTRNDCDDP